MKQVWKNRQKNRIGKKLENRTGASLAEVLIAALILAMVSQAMAVGVTTAQDLYRKSIANAEAQVLYTTIEKILTNELRYASGGTLKGDGHTVDTIKSRTYGIAQNAASLVALDENDTEVEFGELAFGKDGEYHRILGSASYPNNLTAKAEIWYDESKDLFTVSLSIKIKTEEEPCIAGQPFQVLSLEHFDYSS